MTATSAPSRSRPRPGRDSFGQLLHAEWTRFRAARGAVLGMTAAALVIGLLGVLVAVGYHSSCSKGNVEVACPAPPVGPSGDAVSDRFYFVHRSLTGDGSITVRLTSMTGRIKEPPPAGISGPGPEPVPGMTPWAKAGVIIKDGVRQGAPYAAVMVTAEHGVRMQHNFTHDTAGRPGGVSADAPRWLRLTRAGDTLSGYESSDGQRWIKVGTAQVDLPDTVQIGMFAASPGDLRSGGGASAARFSEVTAVFDQVSLQGPWSGDDVGVTLESDGKTPHHPGGMAESGARFTVTGVGDIGPARGGDAGVKIETILTGTSAGMIVVIVVAALYVTAGYRRGRIDAGARRGRVLLAEAVVVAAVAFVTGLAAAVGTLLIGERILSGKDVPILAVPWHTEVQVIVGTAALLAASAVLATALGGLFRRSTPAIVAAIALLVLPNLLATIVPDLPPGLSQWLLRVTPAAGFAVQQSVPAYIQVVAPNLPRDGYYPLPPWAGLAVLCGFAGLTLAWAITRPRRRKVEDISVVPTP
jgi:hypothetical protein